MVGGLAISQIVTLYVTPVFYTYLDELQAWLGRDVADVAPDRRASSRPRGRLRATQPATALMSLS